MTENIKCNLCKVCQDIYSITSSNIEDMLGRNMLDDGADTSASNLNCINCCNLFHHTNIRHVVNTIQSQYGYSSLSYELNINLPPIIDLLRLACKVCFYDNITFIKVPNHEKIVTILLDAQLKKSSTSLSSKNITDVHSIITTDLLLSTTTTMNTTMNTTTNNINHLNNNNNNTNTNNSNSTNNNHLNNNICNTNNGHKLILSAENIQQDSIQKIIPLTITYKVSHQQAIIDFLFPTYNISNKINKRKRYMDTPATASTATTTTTTKVSSSSSSSTNMTHKRVKLENMEEDIHDNSDCEYISNSFSHSIENNHDPNTTSTTTTTTTSTTTTTTTNDNDNDYNNSKSIDNNDNKDEYECISRGVIDNLIKYMKSSSNNIDLNTLSSRLISLPYISLSQDTTMNFNTHTHTQAENNIDHIQPDTTTTHTTVTVTNASMISTISNSSSIMVPLFQPVGHDITLTLASYYLLGRYCKYARDVPQSEWSTPNGDRKGRYSVEEIITTQVRNTLGIQECHMHACGREDINVRCLGNGRPFVLELKCPKYSTLSSYDLHTICHHINMGKGLNNHMDIRLLLLQVTTAEVWGNMQRVAEEKNKGYRCVVYCTQPHSRKQLYEKIDALTDTCTSPQICQQSTCTCGLQIMQRTPLRVLHRRSLLNRPRTIHCLHTTYLNPHYFILDLVTTAGTYVKEFVHGDLGRTVPNIGGILRCPTNILQLDVIWLYDSFPGNLGIDPHTYDVLSENNNNNNNKMMGYVDENRKLDYTDRTRYKNENTSDSNNDSSNVVLVDSSTLSVSNDKDDIVVLDSSSYCSSIQRKPEDKCENDDIHIYALEADTLMTMTDTELKTISIPKYRSK